MYSVVPMTISGCLMWHGKMEIPAWIQGSLRTRFPEGDPGLLKHLGGSERLGRLPFKFLASVQVDENKLIRMLTYLIK